MEFVLFTCIYHNHSDEAMTYLCGEVTINSCYQLLLCFFPTGYPLHPIAVHNHHA